MWFILNDYEGFQNINKNKENFVVDLLNNSSFMNSSENSTTKNNISLVTSNVFTEQCFWEFDMSESSLELLSNKHEYIYI